MILFYFIALVMTKIACETMVKLQNCLFILKIKKLINIKIDRNANNNIEKDLWKGYGVSTTSKTSAN